MEIITLPQMPLADLQSFSESLVPVVEPLPQIAPQVQSFKDAFAVFQKGMTKQDASSDKKTLDKVRDDLIGGLLYGVQSEQLFPYQEKSVKDALKKIVDIADKYGFELTRLRYNQQSSKTDNFIKELEGANISQFPALERWIAPIKKANADFKGEVSEYFDEQTAASDTTAAYLTAPALENAIKSIFTLLVAHRQVADTPELKAAYKKIAKMVAAYRK